MTKSESVTPQAINRQELTSIEMELYKPPRATAASNNGDNGVYLTIKDTHDEDGNASGGGRADDDLDDLVAYERVSVASHADEQQRGGRAGALLKASRIGLAVFGVLTGLK